MLPSQYKMHTAAEFRRTTRQGVRAGGSTVVVYLAPATEIIRHGGPHCGLIVSKKVGNAVTRHRVSRVLRHAMVPLLHSLPPEYGVVVRALPAIAQAETRQVAAELEHALAKCQKKLQRRQ